VDPWLSILLALLGGVPLKVEKSPNLLFNMSGYNIAVSTSSAIPTITVSIFCILTIVSGLTRPAARLF
ncbi:MAG: hypothetical protein SGPRY_013175, partial [Prymnesium sp.]